ncbi:CvpA family protein [Intestinimonas timonensis]|mgnify:FL=1|uniref:CvpA family protein n=1 Tax=Intestinimonas timonensis TaxID=1689270 RepID=UPI001F5E945C|nr:CvpA family protein [Intestinimonas timonensis]
MNGNSPRKPIGKAARVLISLAVTLVFGLAYFYLSLPALNLQDGNFYTFVFVLCIVFVVASLFTSGFRMAPGSGVKEYFRFVKTQCLPVGVLMVLLIAVGIIGTLVSMPIFRASAYRDLLTVEDGNFNQDIAQISFDKIPTLDRSSAEYLGDRQMGTLSDMVSQFEYSNDSTQINYQGRPVRVAPIDYADLIKWFTNRGEGLPAYVLVDMVTQEASVVRLQEGMKYSFSEPLNRNIVRHLRFRYPTYLFDTPQFEIDEEGTPYWIAPRIVRTIGLFGGTDIQGAVLCNAITGECQYYDIDDVPAWVDNVYTPDLIMEQYDYHGTFINGFLNSILGQKGVTMTTEGYNYIALNDDVYVYTGVTSANADQSNLGFLLSNQRTKETRFYEAPGATEYAAMGSAEGEVQDLKYVATFPLLLNIAGEPTYFIPLKDATELVKSYAMVNVAQYQLVAVAGSVSQCEQVYIDLLSQRGIVSEEERPETQISGVVDDIRSAVMDGSTYYFLRLEGGEVYYAVSASENPVAVLLNLGDKVTIGHAVQTGEEDASILSAYSLTIDGKAAPAEPLVTPNETEPAGDSADTSEDGAVTVPIYG